RAVWCVGSPLVATVAKGTRPLTTSRHRTELTQVLPKYPLDVGPSGYHAPALRSRRPGGHERIRGGSRGRPKSRSPLPNGATTTPAIGGRPVVPGESSAAGGQGFQGARRRRVVRTWSPLRLARDSLSCGRP